MPAVTRPLRIGVVVVAYNAESTLERTLDRIPDDFRHRISLLIVSDDASGDATFDRGVGWSRRHTGLPTTVVRHTKNLGYGGNQKAGYRMALDHGVDVVVLLHADGQYAPEALPDMVAPFEDPSVDAVFGSRMMVRGAARAGGMPFYKWAGNRVLTTLENKVLGTDLSEFHSGYRAYRTSALAQVPFEANSDVFDFDTQIIAQLAHAGSRIVEIPIPTFYGDEICYVNGLRYAADVLKDVVEFKLAVRGIGTCAWACPAATGPRRHAATDPVLARLAALPPGRVLHLGTGDGELSAAVRRLGHHVVGVDVGVGIGVDVGVGGLPEVGRRFDAVLVTDALEHVARPEVLLRSAAALLRPGGQLLLATPNFGHWYPRARVTLGLFGYDRGGLLDDGALRFFTRRSLRRLAVRSGLDVVGEDATGLPLAASGSWVRRALLRVDRRLARLRPTLFGYHLVMQLTPHAADTIREGLSLVPEPRDRVETLAAPA